VPGIRPDTCAGRMRESAADRRVFANLECRVTDKRLVNRYNLFILEVVKAWVDPEQKKPKTIHHQGYGTFAVDGPTIKLRSKMR
jgi:flavin reductase (DIM6/NTAB) family NADH-FMN oxidoreductase RutF